MSNKVKCTCGWSWNKSDSSKKDMYICHQCGKDNTMKDGGWLNKFDEVPEAQNGIEGTMGGLTDQGFNYNGAWGGTMAMGGNLPGSVGFTYARTQGSAPANGKYTKKTKASAQNGDDIKLGNNPTSSFFENLFLNSDNKNEIQKQQNFVDDWYRNRKIFKDDGTVHHIKYPTINSNIKPIYTVTGDNMKGLYGQYTKTDNEIKLNRFENYLEQGTPAHEYNHFYQHHPDIGFFSNNSKNKKIGDKYVIDPLKTGLLNNVKNIKVEDLEYDLSPSEIQSRLMEIRYLNNLKPNQKIKPSNIDSLIIPEDSKYLKEKLKSKDYGLDWFLNNIVKNEQQKTIDQAQNGQEMKFYQEGLDWKPKNISKNGIHLEKYLDGGKKTSILAPEVKYMEEYLNSPMYLERLAKMAATEKQLQNDSYGRFSAEQFSHSKVTDPILKVAKNQVANTKDNLKRVKDNIYIGDYNFGDSRVAGTYDSAYKDIRLRKDFFAENPTVGIHELSHATLDSAGPYTTDFHKKYLEPILHKPGTPSWEPIVQEPGEIKARLDSVRYLAKKKGLYDAGKERFTEKHLRTLENDPEIQKDFNFKQLKDQLKKGTKSTGFIWMMNNIAKLQDEESNSLPLAKDGKVITDPNGQWAHPGEITRIPSNQITMQGVDYPVLGISDTGDTQMMYPNQDYTYDGKSVTEYPMMQGGGDVRDGYSDPDYVTGTSRRAMNKMVGMGNYLVPADVLNQAADFAKAKGLDYGANTSGPADAVRHAAAAASTASRIPIPKMIGKYSPNLDRVMRIAAANVLGLGHELRNFNLDDAFMDLKNNYKGSLVGSLPELTDKERNKMIVNQLVNKQLTVDNPKRKKENGGWLSKYN